MKAAHYLLEASLPERFRGRLKGYTSRDIGKFMEQVAEESPQDYARVNQAVGDVGRLATWRQGDTISMRDLKTPFDKKKLYADMDRELESADKNNADPKHKAEARMKVHLKYNDLLQSETTRGATEGGSPFAQSVLSGARGKMPQLKAMIGGTGLYQDHFGNVVPVFGRNSFAEGVRPIDYLASTFGARTTVTTSKMNTARGGYIGKLGTSITSNISVTNKDCGTANGIDLAPDDDSLVGRVLLAPVGDHKAGELINAKVARDIRAKNPDTVLVRSALTCQAENGLCAKCAGAQPGGKLPSIGDQVGVTASQALSEPMIQGSLCLVGGTLVRMADWSEKAIEDINPGEYVLGADRHGRVFPVVVVRRFDNGARECVRTVVKKGTSVDAKLITLESTADHKVLSYQGRQLGDAALDIQPVRIPAHKRTRHAVQLNLGAHTYPGIVEPLAGILGALIGDGCYTGGLSGTGVGFACADDTLLAWMKQQVEPLGLRVYGGHHCAYRLSMVDQNSDRQLVDGKLVRNSVKAALTRYGMFGQSSGTKQLPAGIHTWDNQSVAALIGGLTATDGCVRAAAITFASNSRALLEGVAQLLEWRFGIYVTKLTAVVKRKSATEVYAPTFQLTIASGESMRRFADVIPVPGIKGPRLAAVVAAMVGRTEHKRGRYNVVSQTSIGTRATFDIEVDHEDHLFVLANGLIVSNSMKHLGGAASGKKVFSGLKAIESFLQMPDEYPDRATVSEKDGRVSRVEDAPQGGKFVYVGEDKHYVPQGLELNVKAGDTVEAGDALSDGLVSPADVIRHKGIGEGRRYYAERYKKILDDSGYKANLRNAEAMARAAIDHVDVGDDGVADYLPDDTVSYSRVSALYTPPEDAKILPLGHGVTGKYLQAPALHYSIGTRITPSVLKRLDRAKVRSVTVSDSADDIPFTAVGNRLATATAAGDDWLAKQQSSYLGANIADDALRGRDTNIESNTHWAPRLAYGTGFGKNVETTGKF